MRDDRSIENICAFAACIAYADGNLSHDEVVEIMMMKGVSGYILELKDAIEAFENTGDLKTSLRLVPRSAKVVNEVWSCAPAYISEVYETLDHAVKLDNTEAYSEAQVSFASRIKDPFHQRVAAWLAYLVASVDGLSAFEELLLSWLCRNEFNFDYEENMAWFDEIIFPLIAGEEQDHSDNKSRYSDEAREESLASRLVAEATQEVESRLRGLGATNPKKLLKELIKPSISGPDIETDQEDLPDVFESLESGDWNDVISAIANGADVNKTVTLKGIEGLNILILAAETAPSHVVQALIDSGADINAKARHPKLGTGFEDALTSAIKGGATESFDILVKAGADADPYSDLESGWTPLTMAAKKINITVIRSLISLGVDVNVATTSGENALKIVANNEEADAETAYACMEVLIRAGIDATRADNEGFAPIHNLVTHSSIDVVRLLVEQGGVSPTQKITGASALAAFSTPLDAALGHGNEAVAGYLISRGATFDSGYDDASSPWLQCYSSYSAVFFGAMEDGLANPLNWLRKIQLSTLPSSLETLITIIGRISEVGSDENLHPWASEYFEALLTEIDLPKEFDPLHLRILEPSLPEALSRAPTTMIAIDKKFRDAGLPLLNKY